MTGIATTEVSPNGAVVIPQSLRQITGIKDGAVVTVEALNGTIVIRPVFEGTEGYTPERKAEFLLSNAVDAADYQSACDEVRRLGLDPNTIPHNRPAGV